jgi:DNA-binding IclR family transcriptional regulator
VFAIVGELLEHGGMTPSELGKKLRRPVQTVSTYLARLRTADLVRYEADGGRIHYHLKHPEQIRQLLTTLQGVVAAIVHVPD